MDFLYPKTDFSAPAFKEKLSLKDGDGGLAVGKLVFAENFEKFVKTLRKRPERSCRPAYYPACLEPAEGIVPLDADSAAPREPPPEV
jgi:hypothetical protein